MRIQKRYRHQSDKKSPRTHSYLMIKKMKMKSIHHVVSLSTNLLILIHVSELPCIEKYVPRD